MTGYQFAALAVLALGVVGFVRRTGINRMPRRLIGPLKPHPTHEPKTQPKLDAGDIDRAEFFNYLDRFVLSSVLPSVKTSLHLNDGDSGRIATAFMIGYFATLAILRLSRRPLPAKMADRRGHFLSGAWGPC